MALLYWIQFVIQETSYIETYFRSHEVPVPLLLIEEVSEHEGARKDMQHHDSGILGRVHVTNKPPLPVLDGVQASITTNTYICYSGRLFRGTSCAEP